MREKGKTVQETRQISSLSNLRNYTFVFAEFVFCMFLKNSNFSVLKTLVQISDVTAMTCAFHRLTCEGQRKLITRACSVCELLECFSFSKRCDWTCYMHMCVMLLKGGLWHAFELLWRPCASKPQQQTQNFTFVMVIFLPSVFILQRFFIVLKVVLWYQKIKII